MTNPFYDHTTPPVQGSRGRSSTMRNEFDVVEQGFDLAFNYYVDSGTSANSIVITPTAALTTLDSTNDGMVFRIKVANTINGATTVNFGGSIGTKALRLQDGTALSNQIVANQTCECVWDSAAGYLKLMSSGLSYASNGLPTTGGTMTGAINEAKGASIASAGTVDLQSATGNFVHITGTTTITAITLSAGVERTLIFDDVLTLTHNAITLNLPGGHDIVTAANDRAIVRGDASGVTVISYKRANDRPVAGGSTARMYSFRNF